VCYQDFLKGGAKIKALQAPRGEESVDGRPVAPEMCAGRIFCRCKRQKFEAP